MGRLRRGACAAPLIWALAGAAVAAPPEASPPPAKAAPAPKADPDADVDATVSEVVISGQRRQPGAVVGDIKPEIQLSPADVQSYGVSSVADLLNELSPETRSDRGRGATTPVVLLNGRRISSFSEIRDIPTEAILRVDILPEEVSLKYGYSADQRVVNIVLRRRFRAITGEVGGGGPTEGGQATGSGAVDLLHIRGDDRLNLDLKYQQSTAMTEADRDLAAPASGPPYAIPGNVTAAVPGASIDPALDALAGRPVAIAGVPAGAAGRPLTLSDFAAGAANVTDVSRDRTLLPATRQVTLNAVLSRAVFGDVSATVNGSLSANSSQARLGLPGMDLLVPAGDPFSPFGSDVLLHRYVDSLGLLRQDVDGWTGHLGASLNRETHDWRLSLTSAYDHADTLTQSDTGLGPTAMQALLAARSPGFDPFGPPPADLLSLRAANKARSLSDTLNAQFVASGPLFKLPSGDVYTSFKIGDTQSWFSSRSLRFGVDQSSSLARNDFNAQLNVDVPVTSRRKDFLAFFGDVTLNGNAAIDQVSDFGALTTLGYGVNWTPVTGVTLIVSHTRDQAAPTVQQLGNPTIATPGSRIFDYATGQTVDITRIDGGDPNLVADKRNITKIGLTLKPFSSQNLTVTANYIDSRVDNPIKSFPAVTADIENAFPDRFVRDATGRLVQVDYRPLNFAQETRRELRWGFNYSIPLKSSTANAPRPEFRPPPPPERSGAAADNGGGRSGGGPDRDARRSDGGPGGPGGPGGGFGRGGGGGGFGGRGQSGRLQVAVYHTVFFTDELLVRPGGPVLDLLNGSAAGSTGGQPRHQVEAQFGYTNNGLGARVSANWVSATTVHNGMGPSSGDLNFSDLATINLRLFANLGQRRPLVEKHPWLRGSRVTLSVTNLFDQRMQVRDAAGATPASYQPAYLDPVGRVATVSFRKLFF